MSNLKSEVRVRRSVAKLPQRICDRIEAEYARHVRSYGKRLDPIARSLITQPGLYEQMGDLPLLALFFRSHVVIALSSTPRVLNLAPVRALNVVARAIDVGNHRRDPSARGDLRSRGHWACSHHRWPWYFLKRAIRANSSSTNQGPEDWSLECWCTASANWAARSVRVLSMNSSEVPIAETDIAR